VEVRKVCNTSQTSLPKGVHLTLTTPAVVRPIVVQYDLMCAQGAAEVIVHGRIVESHRQDVVHGGAVFPIDLWQIVRSLFGTFLSF
jgi:hypothetical protein